MTFFWTVGVALAAVAALVWLRYAVVSAGPNELVAIFGRKRVGRGFRLVKGGLALRSPAVEQASTLSLCVHEVSLGLENAPDSEGIAVSVSAVALVKVSSDLALAESAVKKFLGKNAAEIKWAAREIVEAHLSDALSKRTVQEAEDDREGLAEDVRRSAQVELAKMGLELEHVGILTIADSAGILDAIASQTVTEAECSAQRVESEFRSRAEEREAEFEARSSIAQSHAQAKIAAARNELRVRQAELEAGVRAAEAQLEFMVREARVHAEKELYEIRAELVRTKQHVDMILPTEASKEARECRARADAALVRAKANATGQAMAAVATAWKEVGEASMPILMMEDMDKLLRAASRNGSSQGEDGAARVQRMRTVLATVADLTGIEITPKEKSK